eukprot:GHVU01203683.1.p2 GENE.GHVU01203683.1~~GHVU01203683.1.p2  ORF type:complete len:100 (+),score=21.06 GHVU01203683.1:107-406(+)
MATPEVEVKSRLTGSAVKAMVIESFFCASPPESEAPAEQPVISRLVAAAAATHVMMPGVFIVLLDFADHEEGSFANTQASSVYPKFPAGEAAVFRCWAA